MTSDPFPVAIRRMLALAPRRKSVTLIFLMVVTALSEGIGIMLLVPLLHALGPSGEAFGLPLPVLLGGFVMLVLFRTALLALQTRQSQTLVHGVVDGLRADCFDALLQAEWRWISQTRASDHASLIITNVARVGMGLQNGLGMIAGGISLLACLMAALALSWPLALTAIGGAALLMLIFSARRDQSAAIGTAMGTANRALQAGVQEGLTGIRLTRMWQNEYKARAELAAGMHHLRRLQLEHLGQTSRNRIALQTGGAALLALIIYIAIAVLDVSQARLLPLILVFARTVPTLGSLQQSWHQWRHALPALTEAEAFLGAARSVAEPQGEGDAERLPLTCDIRIEGVSVTHEGRQAASLSPVSAIIPARTTVAITGPSGAGKSTLADVLMGLMVADQGRVLIDGQALDGEARIRWRRSVAYVQQDAILFNESIRANLLRAAPDASEEAITSALTQAAAEFALALPEGLDTIIGDNGVRLSGGERQRLALARALLRRPDVLILDEATSAVDPANEALIHRAISALHGQMTIITITHRGLMADRADQHIALLPAHQGST